MQQFEIGILGAGNAAEGIVAALLRNSTLLDDRIIVSNRNPDRRQVFTQRFGIAVTDDNCHLVRNSYILLVAVKPQNHRELFKEIGNLVREDHLIVSIMAGVGTRSIESLMPHIRARVVRVMPNLPMHVGCGMAGVFPGQYASDADLLRAQRIFDAGGKTVHIDDEALMDAVTAVSGSGPAYYYFFTEAIVEAGKRAGLTPRYAQLLAKQACLGAARMMIESNESPDVLRDKVTSPNGTTAAALKKMTDSKVFDDIVEAVLAAFQRGRELGQ
ncbi:MAG: pyrroline-5-carboxylate reductase [Phycisphaerae bacterium]|nr:pyrroline-5-carboxylate reductase [Phycisphaerae bacterium]